MELENRLGWIEAAKRIGAGLGLSGMLVLNPGYGIEEAYAGSNSSHVQCAPLQNNPNVQSCVEKNPDGTYTITQIYTSISIHNNIYN